ncbi:MAG: hypothetical protein AB7F31_07495 [Parachlamydiales bacterium]
METGTIRQKVTGWISHNKALIEVCIVSACALFYLRPAEAAPTLQVTTYNTLAPTYAGINGGAWYSLSTPPL